MTTIKHVTISAGQLSSALTTQEMNNITDLTVAGTIDARDIRLLRDSFANLTRLDLGKATIRSYSGSEGTDKVHSDYPADEMPKGSFLGKTSIKSVVVPDSLTSIGDWAFLGCSKLSGIEIPDSLRSIGNGGFYGCSALTDLTLPESITSIENYAFYGCNGLSSVTIPDAVTSIGNWAFLECSKLRSITISNAVETIGEGAFFKQYQARQIDDSQYTHLDW